MSRNRGSKVYILGAGCSKRSSYPLGEEFGDRLREYSARLRGEDPPKIKQSVENALDLLRKFKVKTLDHLVKSIEDDLSIPDRSTLSPDRARPLFDGRKHSALEFTDWADGAINDAKVATAAMFRDLEVEAAESGLPGYPGLMSEIFGEGGWRDALERTSCHVLTFNYDRLFELAFRRHFKESSPPSLVHEGNVLNSGLNRSPCNQVEILPDRFCFLKLHGSAGWWVHRWIGTKGVTECRQYRVDPLEDEPNRTTETTFFPEHSPYKWEPLLTFPHEKQRDLSPDPRDFLTIPYSKKVWEHAAEVLASAETITIIGYSFAPIDRDFVVKNLLHKATSCERIVLWNPEAENICQGLGEDYPELERLLIRRAECF